MGVRSPVSEQIRIFFINNDKLTKTLKSPNFHAHQNRKPI